MDIRGIDLNLMVVFEAIYHEKHISRAALKIGLSQPAMSSALSRLRDVYKDELFNRSPQGMVPTYLAKQIAESIFKALDLLRYSLKGQEDFDPAFYDNSFRIAMSDWLCLILLPELMANLKKLAPKVNLVVRNLSQKEMHDALMNNQIDLGISGQPNSEWGKFQQKLYREHYESLVWSQHPAIKNRLTLKQFQNYPHILFSPQGTGVGAVDKALKKFKGKRRIVTRVAYSLIIPMMLQNSEYIATCPAPLGRIFSRFMDIKSFKPPLDLPGHDMIQYWSKEKHSDPAHRWFRTLVATICKEFS